MFRFSMVVLALFLCVCPIRADFLNDSRIIISVRDQKLMLLQNGARIATYPVSTSKFGLGDNLGTMTTPLGVLQVAHKIGDNAPEGAVFHNRRWTGEVVKPNSPGRDPIVTRIIWLRGLEPINAHAYYRCIYIHGTPQERFIGRPASYGCIRMRSKDVTALYNQVPIGAVVQIISNGLPKVAKSSPKPPVVIAQQTQARPEGWTTSARSAQKPSELSTPKTRSVTLASLASAPSHLR